MSGCSKVLKKLSEHLQKQHKLEKDESYHDLLRVARRVTKEKESLSEPEIESIDFEKDDSQPILSRLDSEANENETYGIQTNAIMQRFLVYLMSPDAGRRERKSSLQVVTEVRTIVSFFSGNVVNLFNKNKVRDEFFVFLNYFDKVRNPATSKHYMSSLISFMEFKISDDLSLPGLTVDDFITTKLFLHKWRKSYNKEVTAERWERRGRKANGSPHFP